MSQQGLRQLMSRLIGQCEQAMTWEEASYRVAMYCDENRGELADLDVSPAECMTVAKHSIWPDIERERKKIYLGFKFI